MLYVYFVRVVGMSVCVCKFLCWVYTILMVGKHRSRNAENNMFKVYKSCMCYTFFILHFTINPSSYTPLSCFSQTANCRLSVLSLDQQTEGCFVNFKVGLPGSLQEGSHQRAAGTNRSVMKQYWGLAD